MKKEKAAAYTEEEKLSLLKKYMESASTKSLFSREHGISPTSLTNWLRRYEFPDVKRIEAYMKEANIPSEVEQLKDELIRLRKEKKELEKELYGAELKSKAYSMLIDLAEKRYHISIRKNSVAK